MTRDKLEKAIKFGLRKSEGKGLEVVSASIADAIEWAIEMDADSPADPKPEKVVDWPIDVKKSPPLPPPPPATATPSAEREVIEEPAEVRHVASSEKPTPISLEKLIQALNERTPEEISIAFPGKAPYVLLRNVISDPLSKSARLIYKHPPAPDGMESTVVFFAENGEPDIQWGMAATQSMAMKVYSPKKASPPVPVHEYSGPVVENVSVDAANPIPIPDMAEVSTRSFPGGFSTNR
jgi:hypothetical protein